MSVGKRLDIASQNFDVKHGGPELNLSSSQIDELFVAYKDQFVRQQAQGEMPDDEILAYLKKSLIEPETIILFSGDEVVGMIGINYYEDNKDFPNDSIVESKTSIVCHKFRGQKIYGELRKMLHDEVLARCPEDRGVIFTSVTSNEKVIHVLERDGYREVPGMEWANMTGCKVPEEYRQRYGYRAFIDDSHRSTKQVDAMRDQFQGQFNTASDN